TETRERIGKVRLIVGRRAHDRKVSVPATVVFWRWEINAKRPPSGDRSPDGGLGIGNAPSRFAVGRGYRRHAPHPHEPISAFLWRPLMTTRATGPLRQPAGTPRGTGSRGRRPRRVLRPI